MAGSFYLLILYILIIKYTPDTRLDWWIGVKGGHHIAYLFLRMSFTCLTPKLCDCRFRVITHGDAFARALNPPILNALKISCVYDCFYLYRKVNCNEKLKDNIILGKCIFKIRPCCWDELNPSTILLRVNFWIRFASPRITLSLRLCDLI